MKDRWNSERWRNKLVWSRKAMWLDDTVRALATWLGLEPGMTVVDVGCGLGYLGQIYGPHLDKQSRYVGVDTAPKLLAAASRTAEHLIPGGNAYFVDGDAYALPFPDDFADCVMCQTLLMHLENPELALTEMIRVAKPGRLIVCQELDEISGMLTKGYESVPELDLEEELLLMRGILQYHRGRRKLGRGDNNIASKVPTMMKRLGLTGIGVRTNDLPYHVASPYEDEVQRSQLEVSKRFYEDEEGYLMWRGAEKEAILAAGSTPREYDDYRRLVDRQTAILREQLRNGQYSACKVSHFYISKGRKPSQG